MADDVIASAAVGVGARFRSLDDGTREWPVDVPAYVTGGAAGAWTFQVVDATHGLPVAVVGTVPVTGAFWQATQPVSAAALPLPAGAAQEHTAAASYHSARLTDGAAFYAAPAAAQLPAALGQAAMAASVSVAIASNQSAVPVSGTFWQATQPVSAASLPLPAGAAQEHAAAASPHAARLSDGAAFYDAAKTGQLPAALGQQTMAASVGVAIASNQGAVPVSQSGTWNVTVNAALPAGANTVGAVTQASGPWTINQTQWAGTAVDTNSGNKSAGTLRVVLATDQPSLTNAQPVSQSGAPWQVQDQAATSGGLSAYSFLSTAAVQAASIKASAGQVYGLHFFNNTATIAYVRLYNQTTSPATTDTPVYRALIPANTSGAGFVAALPPGVAFGTGIGVRVTAGAADNDATALAANSVLGNVFYK